MSQTEIENIDLLKTKVAQFLTQDYAASQVSKVEVTVGALDPRLRLIKCNTDLALHSQDNLGLGGNINVQVACNGAQRWTILVPAQARVFRPMAVASRNLARGETTAATDIVFEDREMTNYRFGYALKAEEIIGKAIKYPVLKGDGFRTSVLDAPLVVKRGEEVTIESVAGSIRVSSKGTAVTDGRLGQQVRVKNNQSARIINAKVIGEARVQSIL